MGTGGEARIRLPTATQLAAVHFDLTPKDDGVQLALRPGSAPPLRYDGADHHSVVVGYNDEVFVGAVRFSFPKEAATGGVPAWVVIVGLLLFAAGALAVGYRFRSRAVTNTEIDPPTLYNGAATCQARSPAAAERSARQAEQAALAKLDRVAFDTAGGVAALKLLDTAATCFTRAGKPVEAKRIEQELAVQQKRLDEHYAALRLRLRVALDREHPTEALSACDELQSLTKAAGKHPYRAWLGELRAQLQQQITLRQAEDAELP